MSDQHDPFNLLDRKYTGRHRAQYTARMVWLAGVLGFVAGASTVLVW